MTGDEPKGLDGPSEAELGSADISETVPEKPSIPRRPDRASIATPSHERLFHQNPLFRGLDRDEILTIIEVADRRNLEPGDVLFEQGESADALWLLEAGELQVKARSEAGEDVVLAVLGPGTIVGELSLISGGPRSATVEVLSEGSALVLARDEFSTLRQRWSPGAYKLMMNLIALIEERKRETEARVQQVFDDPAKYIDSFEEQVGEILARMHKA